MTVKARYNYTSANENKKGDSRCTVLKTMADLQDEVLKNNIKDEWRKTFIRKSKYNKSK